MLFHACEVLDIGGTLQLLPLQQLLYGVTSLVWCGIAVGLLTVEGAKSLVLSAWMSSPSVLKRCSWTEHPQEVQLC